MLYIDPDSCIDCDLCRPECSVEAIFIADASAPCLRLAPAQASGFADWASHKLSWIARTASASGCT